MCTTTMDARITTTAARTSAHPGLRAGLRILRRVTAIRIAIKPFQVETKTAPEKSGAVLY
jgi:hypothetical protein